MQKTTFILLLSATIAFFAACSKKPDAIPLPKPAETPEAAVEQVVTALEDGKPQNIYGMLPQSYQDDVSGLVSSFATKMDGDLWESGLDVAKSISDLYENKKDMILNSPMIKDAPESAMMSENYDKVADIIDSVLESDLADLHALKKGNITGILAGPGEKIMELMKDIEDSPVGEILAEFKGQGFKTIEENGELWLEVPDPTGESESSRTKLKFVKVEGRWIPEDLQTVFTEGIASAKSAVEELDMKSMEFQLTSAFITGAMSMAKGTLDTLRNAKTQEEFDQAFENLGAKLPITDFRF